MSTISSISSLITQPVASAPALNAPMTPAAVTREDIEWAKKLDKKMELGYIPNPSEQSRYNKIVAHLTVIKDEGGLTYEDKTSFSNNPRGFSAIGSMVGRAFSGGYVGYKYSHDVAGISRETYQTIKNGIAAGEWGTALKGFAGGVKQTGVIALKAGGISSAINAGTSLISNVLETAGGRQTAKEAVGNVAADTVGGFLSGLGATVFSGAATLGMSLSNVGGLPITIAGVAGGVVGSLLLDKAYKASGLFTMLKNKVMRTMEPAPSNS